MLHVRTHSADSWCDVLPAILYERPWPISNHVLYIIVQTVSTWMIRNDDVIVGIFLAFRGIFFTGFVQWIFCNNGNHGDGSLSLSVWVQMIQNVNCRENCIAIKHKKNPRVHKGMTPAIVKILDVVIQRHEKFRWLALK